MVWKKYLHLFYKYRDYPNILLYLLFALEPMMINVKHDSTIIVKVVLQEQLELLDIPHTLHGSGEIEVKRTLSTKEMEELTNNLNRYGIQILGDQKIALVQRIKNAINEMLQNDLARSHKVSSYLTDTLNYSYTYLSNLFSETTYTSIENFVILRKVDHAKELMANTNLTLTEIAYRLNYSSVAHLSSQFKKTTGLTPTTFQKILKKRKEHRIQQTLWT